MSRHMWRHSGGFLEKKEYYTSLLDREGGRVPPSLSKSLGSPLSTSRKYCENLIMHEKQNTVIYRETVLRNNVIYIFGHTAQHSLMHVILKEIKK